MWAHNEASAVAGLKRREIMEPFATIQDVITLFRPLKPEEEEKAEALLEVVSARLRQEAFNNRRNLDQMSGML